MWTPKAVNEWLTQVVGPIIGVVIAAYLLLTRASLEAYDLTLIVMFIGMRFVTTGPSSSGSPSGQPSPSPSTSQTDSDARPR